MPTNDPAVDAGVAGYGDRAGPDTAEPSTVDLVQSDRRFDLQRTFLLRQDQLLSTLGVGRGVADHPVAVGDATELNWKGMLESILPARYRVSKAFVVDADGRRSDQIDLLIYDRHFSPVLIDVGEYPFVPAEATYCALEVKQRISRQTILYASKKVASVRRLRRTSVPIPSAAGTLQPRVPAPILGGLLALDTNWRGLPGGPLTRALDSSVADGGLDLGCALLVGSFERGSVGSPPEISQSETALIFFVLRLLKRLQGMASVPAIDFDEYGSALAGE